MCLYGCAKENNVLNCSIIYFVSGDQLNIGVSIPCGILVSLSVCSVAQRLMDIDHDV